MQHLVLDQKQADIVNLAVQKIPVYGPDGGRLAFLKPHVTPDLVVRLKSETHEQEPSGSEEPCATNALILNEQQAGLVIHAPVGLTAHDVNGTLLGWVEPDPGQAMIAGLTGRARARQPCYTGKQIQARLRALEVEWDRTGGFDRAYMHRFLRDLDEKDPPVSLGFRDE